MKWTHKKISYTEVSHFNKEIKKKKKNRYHFITDNYQSVKYKSIPYFKGTLLWNSLADDVISFQKKKLVCSSVPCY